MELTYYLNMSSAPSIAVQLTYDMHDIQSYTPGYTAPPPRVPSDDTAIDIRQVHCRLFCIFDFKDSNSHEMI